MATQQAIPGPRGRDALRFLGFGNPDGLLAYFLETAQRYGPISSLRVLGQHVVLLDDADLIEDMLQTQQHRFVRDAGAALLREITGDGVLTLDDPGHLRRRRLLQPAFHRARIAHYVASMTAIAQRTADHWHAGERIDVGAAMMRLTLDVVGSALFGDEVGCADQIADVVSSIGRRGGRLQPLLAALAPALLAVRKHLPQHVRLVFGRERAALERIVDPIIARRRAAGTGGSDLLSMLLEARDENGAALGDVDIRNELITFVLAGHETTSSALTWAWYLLGRHPDVESRFHAEVDAVLGGRAATMDDVRSLPYTASIFTEALRLYPPAAAFARRPTERVNLGGFAIPRFASVFVSPYVTHRNPRYFPEPLAFRPERWENAEPPKFAFFPFGGGAKMCIGEPFARAEGVVVLATIAQRWRLSIDARAVAPAPSALLRPSAPIWAEVTLRRPRADRMPGSAS